MWDRGSKPQAREVRFWYSHGRRELQLHQPKSLEEEAIVKLIMVLKTILINKVENNHQKIEMKKV